MAKTYRTKRGIVMAIRGQQATVLTPEGEFFNTSIGEKNICIGDEMTVEILIEHSIKPFRVKHRMRLALIVASFMVSACVSWAVPVGHVYMDVNPSIGLSYNVFERVIQVEAFNEDAKVVKASLDIYGRPLEESVAKTLVAIDQKGFVKSQSGAVILGFSSADKRLQAHAIDGLTNAIEKVNKPVDAQMVQVSETDIKQTDTSKSSPIKTALSKGDLASSKPIKTPRLEAIQKSILLKQKQLEDLKNKQQRIQNQQDPSMPSKNGVPEQRLNRVAVAIANKEESLKALQAQAAHNQQKPTKRPAVVEPKQNEAPQQNQQVVQKAPMSPEKLKALMVLRSHLVEKLEKLKSDKRQGPAVKAHIEKLENQIAKIDLLIATEKKVLKKNKKK